MTIQTYLDIINQRFKTGISREHTYRGDLQTLLMTLLPDALVTNEPARVDCGAPDYVLTKKDIPVGYIEAKDIGVDLNSKTLKEQFDRYRSGLNNLIFTDYLDFHFYKDGLFVTSIAIGKIEQGNIIPIADNFNSFEALIKNFALTVSQTIKNPTKLAEMMAGKAKLMADVIEKSLNHDDETETKSALKSQMLSFKQMLIHDINNSAFADIYAQTIAYGMFAARYHDPTLPTFSRQEAATLIPKSNPFLRKLFQDIAGYDLDNRLVWMVDELVNIFLATDVADIMKNFGRSTKQEDPVVHFYETFLASYNPALRKSRGVWYTPQPVVNFIVRAVDDILKTEFNLPQGLGDTSKVKIKTKAVTKATNDQRSKLKQVEVEREVHKVQILDPATGTGTFLAEVVKHIYKKFEGQQGIWSNYVNQHLIPRLNGFELLMASYAMAHLKMDMLLTETGYKSTTDQRFRIFLTNSLEEDHPDTGTLFSSWLSDEADQANTLKRNTPVMVIMGNPPYSGISSNNGEWISSLIDDYKYIDGEHFGERKHWLNDDYVKFIRFGQHFIDKNGEGILAFINPHGYLDNPTFRGMRWNLLQSFDQIYTIDLHGNSKKKEVAPDGSVDTNVFDIMQGVSINLFIKSKKKNVGELAKVKHYDLFGKRESKYKFLSEQSIRNIEFKEIFPDKPFLFFVPKSNDNREEFETGFKLDDLFTINSVGIVSARDKFCTDDDIERLKDRIERFSNLEIDDSKIANEFSLKDTTTFNLTKARSTLSKEGNKSQYLRRITYRPFDDKWIFYHNEIVERSIMRIMKHFLKGENLGLIVGRQGQVVGSMQWNLSFITNNITDFNLYYRGGGMSFPLYLYSDNDELFTLDGKPARVPNLNMDIVDRISRSASINFSPEENHTIAVDTEIYYPNDVLDYVYAMLYSPLYREKYKEFLKVDFPRIPYPKNSLQFFKLVKFGKQIRELHLLESEQTENYITQYPIDGYNNVTKPFYQQEKVYINETQYFDNVPEVAWNFYIGGYQPAQKWLKDRKGKALEFEDIQHYQKIIVALTETARLMKEIDLVILEK